MRYMADRYLYQTKYYYEPQNLSEIIKSGCLKNRDTIHRLTIDKATKKKKQLESIAL